MSKFIVGRGGSSSSSSSSGSSDENSLRSKSYATIIDLLGEGEWEEVGVGGLKGIYLDDVPVQNQDDTYNFEDFTIETRSGTVGQSRMSIATTTENADSIGVRMYYNVPVEHVVLGTEVDIIRVSVSIPNLYSVNTTSGNSYASSVSYKIEWKPDTSSEWIEAATEVVEGKCTSTYERQTSFRVSGASSYTVRCTRLTVDSTSDYLFNETYFASTVAVVEDKFRYPCSVLVGLSIDAEQFSSVPTRAYKCKMLRIKVPTNYDPTTRAYDGTWDGTFKVAWSDNPAWCLYDLLTNTRYGLGERIPEEYVDKWELYTIAQYCDELVENPDGTTEPRFTCNVYINSLQEAYKVVSDMVTIFRGMAYWGNGNIVSVQDSPKEAGYAFTNANVGEDGFIYQSSALNTRYNTVKIKWNNLEDYGRQWIEYVEDTEAIASMGYVNDTAITAFGCTSRYMARRIGKWLLYTNTYETETISFTVGMDGAIPRPGDVIKVSDILRSEERRGGRIRRVVGTTIYMDAPLTFTSGVTYTLSYINNEGVAEDIQFTASGELSEITFDSLPATPAKDSIFIISDDNIPEALYRIVSVTEKDGGYSYEIGGVSYNPSKYAYIESNEALIIPSTKSTLTYPVEEINITEELYVDGVSVKTKATVSWTAPKYASSYSVYIITPDGQRISKITKDTSLVLEDVVAGGYEFTITAINLLNQSSSQHTTTLTVYGKTLAPSALTGLAIKAFNNQGILTWDTSVDLDVRVGGVVYIRHTTKAADVATWEDGISIGTALGGDNTASIPLLIGTYMLKAQDSSGLYSEAAVVSSSTVALIQNLNVVETQVENPSFIGTKTNMVLNGSSIELADNGSGGKYTYGEYAFSAHVDLGKPMTTRVSAALLASAYALSDNIDNRLTPIDTWSYFDGITPANYTVTLYISTTTDDPDSVGAVWKDWEVFFVSDYYARGFKFKLVVTTETSQTSISISSLSVTLDMPGRVEGENDIVIPNTGADIEFLYEFAATPAIAIHIDDMATGDYYTITNKTAAGFHIVVKNSSGTAVQRQIDWLAKGYGYVI